MSSSKEKNNIQTQQETLSKKGAPTKYKPEMCDLVIEVAKNGGFHAAMMVACGITNDTFYAWKRDNPEFREAVEAADLISLALQEDYLMKGMTGQIKNYNFSANAMILNNKWRHMYARTTGGGDTTEITVNNLNLSRDEVNAKIAQKLENLKKIGQYVE